MAEIKEVFQITTLPGIKRDGTNLDGDSFVDGQWVRFVRKEGRPKKMGGYQETRSPVPGPVRALQVWTRGDLTEIISASQYGVTQANVDVFGGSGTTYDRTPTGFTNGDGVWTLETMFDDAAGSKNTLLIAHRANSLRNIDDSTATPVYQGVVSDTTALTAIAGLSVSGGVCPVGPYLVYYGSDGLVGWSDVNQPQTLTGGDAGSDRVTGAKVVKALPLRAGSGPSALLWSLDSVLRMDYVGGAAIFKFSTITAQSSVLSQNSVIEYDGDYFWVGIDRFMVYSGGKVQELPNLMCKNWFFDNLNFEQRQKVWATKVPRYSEVIWFFPFGDATECNKAVVYNTQLGVWYDFELSRTAGYYSQVFPNPVWAGEGSSSLLETVLSGVTGSYVVGDSVTGGTSGNTFVVYTVISGTKLVLRSNAPNATLANGEALVNNSRSGAGTTVSSVRLHSTYIHEKGRNAVTVNDESAIYSMFETSDFGYPTGGAQQNNIKGLNRWTRLVRVEPDFKMQGDMLVEVAGREFAQQTDTYSHPFTFDRNTGKIDTREQRRQIRLRFTSNVLNGDFEMGRVILHTEPGDVRS